MPNTPMPTTPQAKRMARALREALAARDIAVTHSDALEFVAKSLDYADWNTLAARTGGGAAATRSDAGVELKLAVPIIRIFDVEKAKSFYVDLLGFAIGCVSPSERLTRPPRRPRATRCAADGDELAHDRPTRRLRPEMARQRAVVSRLLSIARG